MHNLKKTDRQWFLRCDS